MENLVAILICLPFLLALLPVAVSNEKARGCVVYAGGAVIALLSVVTAVLWFRDGTTMIFDLPASGIFDKIILAGDFILMFVIIWLSVKHHKTIISLLSVLQTGLVVWAELFGPKVEHTAHIRLDWLSFIMILIIGVIGVAIGIYAVGYMRGYHEHHKDIRDRRRFFFAMIFLFYGAMFGLVTSMNVIWRIFSGR